MCLTRSSLLSTAYNYMYVAINANSLDPGETHFGRDKV